MPKIKLSHVAAMTARCQSGKKKTDYYDEAITGFVLECRSTGGRTYYLRYEDAAGRQKQHKIGRYEDITFAVAKKMAEKLRSDVVQGGDPGAAKAAVKAIPLYSELAKMHLADAELHQRSYSTTEMYIRRHILPKWGKVRLTDINGRAVAQGVAPRLQSGTHDWLIDGLSIVRTEAWRSLASPRRAAPDQQAGTPPFQLGPAIAGATIALCFSRPPVLSLPRRQPFACP